MGLSLAKSGSLADTVNRIRLAPVQMFHRYKWSEYDHQLLAHTASLSLLLIFQQSIFVSFSPPKPVHKSISPTIAEQR